MELKRNGTYHLLSYADDMNVLRYNVDTLMKNTSALINTTKEGGQYSKNYQVKEYDMGRTCSMNRVRMISCRLLVGKPK